MPAVTRLLRTALLVAVTLTICLYLLPTFRGRNPLDLQSFTTEVTQTCLPGSDDGTCNDTAELHITTTTGATTMRSKPSGLVYPPGFKQFDTSNPNSPYNQNENDDPVADLLEDDPDVIIESMKSSEDSYWDQISRWVPYNARYNVASQNPVIWQTYREEPGINALPYQSWLEKNKPQWTRHFLNDAARESLIASYGRDLPFLQEIYNLLPAKILKLDFLRYVSLYKDGGVYADIDTAAYQSIDDWYAACYSEAPSRNNGKNIRSQQPGLIVGIEFDVGKDPRFDNIDGRKLAIGNYVFAANKGHPALAKAIHNIVRTTFNRSQTAKTTFAISDNGTEVYEWTGRKMWTDSIIGHIQETVKGFKERDLLDLKKAKVVNDICILPMTAFGSGQLKYQSSPESNIAGVMVKHFSMHMWDDIAPANG